MDWNGYEDQFRIQAQALAPKLFSSGDIRSSSRDRSGRSDFRRSAGGESYRDEENAHQNSEPPDFLSGEIQREMEGLRSQLHKQSRKISMMEKMLSNYGEILSSSGDAQMSLASKLDELENDFHTSIQSSSSLARDRSELLIQTKTLSSRVGNIEQFVRTCDSQFATKVGTNCSNITFTTSISF